MNKIFFFSALLVLTGCKIETGTDESSRFKVFNYALGSVDFNVLKENVLKSQCIQCHSWAISETEVAKRIVPGNPEASALYRVVKSGQMPSGKPRLTDQALVLVEQYILHVSPDVIIKPIPLAPTYASLKVNLFEQSCVRCHNPDVKKAHPNRPLLDSKEAIIARYDDVLYSVTDAWNMNDNEMPPERSDVPRLTEEMIKVLIEWKESGFKD